MKRGKELHAQWLKAACSLPLDVINSEEEIIKAIENQNTKLSADYLVTLKNKVFKKKKWPDNSPVQLKNKSSRKLLKKKESKRKKNNQQKTTNKPTNKQTNKQTNENTIPSIINVNSQKKVSFFGNIFRRLIFYHTNKQKETRGSYSRRRTK